MAADPVALQVLTALAAGDWAAAASSAAACVGADDATPLVRALDEFLQVQQATGVYDEPRAFEAFIDNGTNPELYRLTIEAIAAVHATDRPTAVLDIGCGDGRVVSAVLAHGTRRVDLVEPSRALLAEASTAVARPGVDVVAHAIGAGDLPRHVGAAQRWPVVESTYALHTTTPHERPELFAWLAERAERLLVVEFDVPPFADRSPEHVAYLAERYEAGVAEYRDHPEVVRGFLLPVLVGQLDPARHRYTFEQPIAAWTQQLHEAGFTTETTPIFDYWWAPATLIDARPRPATA